jgi:hypothetical protein
MKIRKNLTKKLSYAIYIVLVAFMFTACNGGTKIEDTMGNYVTVTIEGCEYMHHEVVGKEGLVHKGNCSNEIHICNCN